MLYESYYRIMIAHVAKKPYGYQVIVGETIKGAYTKTYCNSTYNGATNAKKKADEHLTWYCDTHGINPPIRGYLKRSYKEEPRNNNESGFSGVFRSSSHDPRRPKSTDLHYWIAHYYLENSKIRYKRYSIKSFGEERAKSLAIEFRKGWEDALREGEEALARFFEEDKIKTEELKLAPLIEAQYASFSVIKRKINKNVGYMARIRISGTKKDAVTKFFNFRNHSTQSAALKVATKWVEGIFEKYDLEDVSGKRIS